ncbi:MAG: N-acetylmuramoyl-L-alanine amidase family protein [Bacillota bacterium]
MEGRFHENDYNTEKMLYITASVTLVSLFALFSFVFPPHVLDFDSAIIVIDPGHGGIDGGTNKDGLLEKDVNLVIAKKLKALMEKKGYTVIMTREEDISLDSLDDSNGSKHQRDLNARANIINNSNARLFLSIHVDCNLKKPDTNGSIVFYNDKFPQSKALAYCIQRALNSVIANGKNRMTHDPQQADFFILRNSEIPGVIIEVYFQCGRKAIARKR